MKNEVNKYLTEKTKIPIVWFFIASVALSGVVLFLADIQSLARINSVKTKDLKEKLQVLQQDIKSNLKEIRQKLDEIQSQCYRR